MSNKRKRTSRAWEHFTPTEDGIYAKCFYCQKEIKTPGGCTSGMSKHLTLHDIHLNDEENRNPTKAKTVDSNELISKLVAQDGLPFLVLTTSESIMQMYEVTTNKKMPRSPSTIRQIMLQCYADKKAIVISQIRILKEQGKKISVTLDEWTSGANRRYMNVNLHTVGKFWNLGLARITGSFTSEACLLLLQAKLEEFEVELSDVFAISTDGAATMKRFGQLSGRKHLTCIVHGIHLAVVDVLYKSNVNWNYEGRLAEQEVEDEEGEILSTEPPICDGVEEEPEFHPSLKELVTNVRKTVMIFRKSPMKTEVLIRYSDSGKTLILDSRTRWNSLVEMLERVSELKDALKKSMIDINEELLLTEHDFVLIDQIIETLRPVKVAVEAICRRDANLVNADVALNFMMRKLLGNDCELSQKLYIELKRRILERRSNLSEVAAYLHYANEDEQLGHTKGYFTKISRTNIFNIIKTIYETLKDLPPPPLQETNNTENTESESLLAEVSLSTELSLEISHAMMQPKPNSRQPRDQSAALTAAIKREALIFESSGSRSKTLQMVYDVLMTVPPSTVEAERAFSSANNFCRKIRTRLADTSLNALVVLKAYFKKH